MQSFQEIDSVIAFTFRALEMGVQKIFTPSPYNLVSGRTQASRSETGIGRLMYSRAMTKLLAGPVSKRTSDSYIYKRT